MRPCCDTGCVKTTRCVPGWTFWRQEPTSAGCCQQSLRAPRPRTELFGGALKHASAGAQICHWALGLSVVLSPLLSARAQNTPRKATKGLMAIHALDTWLVSRYSRAQLLSDSLDGHSPRGEELPARIESATDASSGDSLFAVQFRSRRESSSLHTGATIRLTGPTGSITTILADVVARRPFRAPRRPGADTTAAGGWRYGWAYLALVRRRYAGSPASTYRGWVMLDVPDTSRRR